MDQPQAYDPYALDSSGIVAAAAQFVSALRKIGPGIILAGSIVGTGELLLTTSLGAEWGFLFLWLILFSCVVKVFIQVELGRYALSSGKPTLAALDSLPGWRLGAHWLVWWWFIMLMFTVSQLGAMAGGVGQALDLAFPNVVVGAAERCESVAPDLAASLRAHPDRPWAIATALVAVALLLSGGYRRIEHVTTFLVAGVTLLTVICVGLLPSMGFTVTWGNLGEGISPEGWSRLTPAAMAAAFGAFGITGVGASELYAYPYWCLEKGYARFTGPRTNEEQWAERARGWLRVMQLDAWVSMVVFTVATVAFYILGATVLHDQHLVPKGKQMIATLSEMYVPTFGSWTKLVFLIGAWAVLFKTLYVASASNSRLTADFFGLARFVRYRDGADRAKWIRRCCIVYPLLGLCWYLAVGDPRTLTIIGGYVQAATLPIIAGAALFLRYRRLDPRLAPSRVWDTCLWLAFLSISVVAIYAIEQKLLDL